MDLVDVEDAFESCLALEAAARESCEQFDALLLKEYEATNLQLVIDNDWHQGLTVRRFSTTAKPSIKLRKLGYNILSDCRHGLDQAVVAASRLMGVPSSKTKIYFPFATDEEDFDKLYGPKGRYRDTAPALIPELKKFKPWWGGDDELRTLGKLSGPNKHQVIIDFAPEITSFKNGAMSLDSMIAVWLPPRRSDRIMPDETGGLSMESPRGRTDFILSITKTDSGSEFGEAGGLAVYCAKEATRLHGRSIDVLMNTFVGRTAYIIERIKAFAIEQVVA